MRRFDDGDRRLEARLARRGGDGAHDLRFEQHVVGAADHDQVLDVVAAHQHQLTLSVERKGVDQAEPRLAGAARAGHPQAMAENEAIDDGEDQRAATTTAATMAIFEGAAVGRQPIANRLTCDIQSAATVRIPRVRPCRQGR